MTPTLLDELEELLRREPGELKVSNYRPQRVIRRSASESTYHVGDDMFPTIAHCEEPDDGRLFVAAINALPALLKAARENERLRAALGKAQSMLVRIHHAARVREEWQDGENEAEAWRSVCDYLFNVGLDPTNNRKTYRAALSTTTEGVSE